MKARTVILLGLSGMLLAGPLIPGGLAAQKCLEDQNFNFSTGSGNFSADELQAITETAVGEAGTSYVPGEIEAIMATMFNRLNYNRAFADAAVVAGKHYPDPFTGGENIVGVLTAGYDAYNRRSGINKLNGAMKNGVLPANSYARLQLEAARAFAIKAARMAPDQLVAEYPYTYNLGEGMKPKEGAFNVTYFGNTVVYMRPMPW